jgi:hypothetical protein
MAMPWIFSNRGLTLRGGGGDADGSSVTAILIL